MTTRVIRAGPNWMSTLPSELQDESLYRIAIPGSHNSCSVYMNKESNVDRESDPLFNLLYEELGELATEISYRWTQTQSRTLTQQLDMGIRYLDLRVIARKDAREEKHVFVRNGPSILLVLKEIRRWLDLHPREVVLIDFRVVHKLSPVHHRYLLANMSQDVFEGKMVPLTENISSVTLRNIWALGLQVIVFYPKEYISGYSTVWPNNYIDYYVAGTQTHKEMIEKIDLHCMTKPQETHFFCLDGVLSLTNDYLAEHLDETLKNSMAIPALKAVTSWVRDKDRTFGKINIVTAEFVHLHGFCRSIISVNQVRKTRKQPESEKLCTLL